MPKRPLSLCTLAFILGILLASTPWVSIASGCVGGILLALGILIQRDFWVRLGLIFLMLPLGTLLYLQSLQRRPDDISYLPLRYFQVTGVVESDPQLHAASSPFVTLNLKVLSVEAQPVTGRIFVLLSGKSRINSEGNTFVSSFPEYGDVISLKGRLENPRPDANSGEFSVKEGLARRGIDRTLRVNYREEWGIVPASNALVSPFLRAAMKIRHTVLGAVRSHFSPLSAGVLNGILLGAQSDLPADLREAFQKTGTAHLLATAGLHLGILIALLFWLLKASGVSRRPACVLLILFLVGFVFVAGGRPAVVRAAFLGGLTLLGYLIEREPDWWNMTSLAALILLIDRPAQLYDEGFQLTFVTVTTLIALSPFLSKPLHALKKKARKETGGGRFGGLALSAVAGAFLLSLGAQIGVFGRVLPQEHQISLFACFANALLVPLILPIFLLGLFFFLSLPLSPLTALTVCALDGLLRFVIFVVREGANVPGGTITAAELPDSFPFLYYGLLWSALFALHSPHRSRLLLEQAESEAEP